jgi:hypothetical protein
MAVRDGSTFQDITSSTATWTVPAAPLTHHTQLLYYFNALASPKLLLQPVLRFSFDGWSVNSWFLTPTMNYVTTTVPVQVGQVLTGVMTQTKHSATSYSVTSKFTGLANSSFSGPPRSQFTTPMPARWKHTPLRRIPWIIRRAC